MLFVLFCVHLCLAVRSVNTTSSPTHATLPTVPGVVTEEDSTLIFSELNTTQYHVTEMHSGNGATDIASPEEDKIEQQSRMETESADLETFQAQNRRLLPNFKNPLHVIDGPEQRYFIGIIDIFTVYGFKKRLEYLWKRLRHPRKTFSHSQSSSLLSQAVPVGSGPYQIKLESLDDRWTLFAHLTHAYLVM